MKLFHKPFIVIVFLCAFVLGGCSLLPGFLGGQSSQQITPTGSSGGSATASGPVAISALYAYTDSYDYFHVVGEITNTSDAAISNIKLAFSLKDGSGVSMLTDYDGNTVETLEFDPFVTTLEPGDSSAFDYSNYYESTPGAYEVLYVSSGPATATRGSVEVRNTHFVDDGSGNMYYFGELVNTGSAPVDISGFAVGLKDAAGQLKAASYSMNLVEYLAPAGDAAGLDSGPFGVTLYAPSEAGLTPQVYFYPEVVEARDTPPLVLSFTNSYFDAYDQVHLVGTVTNDGTQQVSFPIQFALQDQAGVILDTNYYSFPVSLDPGISMPFNINYWTQINYNPTDQAAVSNMYMQVDPYWVWETTYAYENLTSVNVNLEDGGDGILHVTGDVTNDSGKDLYSMCVFIWFTDAQDNLVGTSYTTLYPSGDAFTSNETAAFDFYANLDSEADYAAFDYTLQVLGQVK